MLPILRAANEGDVSSACRQCIAELLVRVAIGNESPQHGEVHAVGTCDSQQGNYVELSGFCVTTDTRCRD